MTWSSKANLLRLAEIASRQGSFFTAGQAKEAGYVDAVHGYHVANGDWEKCYRGIYRLVSQPLPEWPELITWSLWSRDRHGVPLGVFSHDTAAMVHGMIPKTPGPVHMTVPKSFRKNCEIPGQITLHKEDLELSMIEQRQGYAVVRMSPVAKLVIHRSYDDVISAGED